MRGVHAGAIVLVGVLALNLGNYVFHLIAARSLGPARVRGSRDAHRDLRV